MNLKAAIERPRVRFGVHVDEDTDEPSIRDHTFNGWLGTSIEDNRGAGVELDSAIIQEFPTPPHECKDRVR